MSDVEKVARAIWEVIADALHSPKPCDPVWEGVRDRNLMLKAALAAIAAMGEREANDTSYRLEALEMWAWGGRHNMPEHTRQRLPASPRPEAVEEAVKAERERCAKVVDAIADEHRAAYERNRAAGYTHDNDLRALQTAWCIAAAIRATEGSKG